MKDERQDGDSGAFDCAALHSTEAGRERSLTLMDATQRDTSEAV